jgi:hypothetical protein
MMADRCRQQKNLGFVTTMDGRHFFQGEPGDPVMVPGRSLGWKARGPAGQEVSFEEGSGRFPATRDTPRET